MCIASTGAAASLIGGSTYHSVLNISHYGSNSNERSKAEIHERLKYVDYVFFDEISMVDCTSLFKICAKMDGAMRLSGSAFDGINIITAGDFAQLDPPGSGAALF